MPHKLLLADDSVTIQRVIELTFADEDVQVIAVGDGKQAIERLQTDRPDIVLADIGMPERDGYEVASFIKSNAALAHIPVLLLTGAFEPIDEGRARAVGCDGVLVKPFEPQMVISRVKDLIAGRRSGQDFRSGGGADVSRPEPVPDTMRAAAAAPRQPDASARPAVGVPAGSIEDYFDRLDAAFASMDGSAAGRNDTVAPPQTPPPSAAPTFGLADELAQWDPDLSVSPQDRTAQPAEQPFAGAAAGAAGEAPAEEPSAFDRGWELEPTPTSAIPEPFGTPHSSPVPPAAPLPSAAAPAPAPPLPTLAEAFAALLAAEQGLSLAPAPSKSPAAQSEEVIEEVTRRVIGRLGDSSLREVVLEAAERLVRDEIARLKRDAAR